MSKPRHDFDDAWKEVLEHYFPDFMAFFFPQAYEDIDWSRGVEFLDKELQYAVRQAVRGRRTVDKLVKVWRKDGEEMWVLTHVEVQSQVDQDFPQRMYIWVMILPTELEREYEEAVERYEEEQTMPLISNFERRAMARVAREDILEVLNLRFTEPPPTLLEHLGQLDDLSVLKRLHRQAVTAGSLEEFEKGMPKPRSARRSARTSKKKTSED